MSKVPKGEVKWIDLSKYLSLIVIDLGDCGARINKVGEE